MPESIFQVVEARANDLKERRGEEWDAQRRSLEAALQSVFKEQSELTSLRLRHLLSDDEFLAKRQELKQDEIRLQRQLEKTSEDENEFEPVGDFILLRNKAADWFQHGNPQTKKQILYITGSNLSLKNKILNIEARKPFRQIGGNGDFFSKLAYIDDVRKWVMENRVEARILSNSIKELARQAALEEKKVA